MHEPPSSIISAWNSVQVLLRTHAKIFEAPTGSKGFMWKTWLEPPWPTFDLGCSRWSSWWFVRGGDQWIESIPDITEVVLSYWSQLSRCGILGKKSILRKYFYSTCFWSFVYYNIYVYTSLQTHMYRSLSCVIECFLISTIVIIIIIMSTIVIHQKEAIPHAASHWYSCSWVYDTTRWLSVIHEGFPQKLH